MQLETMNLIGMLFFGGIALALAWFALLVLAQVWARAWNWIDDGDNPIQANPILQRLMKIRGYELRKRTKYSDSVAYWNKKDECGDSGFFIAVPALILFLSPTVIFLSMRFYPVPIAIGTLAVIAYLARFARRHKKLFDKHIKDPLAHKAEASTTE